MTDKMIGDFHIHTKYSPDSLMNLKRIVQLSKIRNLDIIAITDHDTISNLTNLKEFENRYHIKIIQGGEFTTDIGDIIGLRLIDTIKSRHWRDVIDEIKNQGGLSIFPHPFRGHKNDMIDEVAKEIDRIEVWNGRSTIEQNNLAFSLAEKFGKKRIAGSDAHLYSEIGDVRIQVNSFLEGEELVLTKNSNQWDILRSQLIRHLKRVKLSYIQKKFNEKTRLPEKD